MMWDPEKENRLQELWNSTPMSAREIGIELQMSRNSIIGKASRLGLSRKTTGQKPRQKKESSPRPPRSNIRIRASVAQVVEPAAHNGSDTGSIPVTSPIHFLDLKEKHCRSVVGCGEDGLALFCDKDKAEGSYCLGHARLYYNYASRRR